MTVASDRDKLRLQIGDTDVDPDSDALFSDEELDVFLDRQTIVTTGGTAVNVLLAAADACDVLANRFAREFDFAEDGQSFSRSQRAANYRLQARELRNRGSGASSVPLVSSVNTAIQDAADAL